MSVPYAKIKERKRVATMSKLLRSKDRKVANAVTPNGKQASIANTFGLPAGKNYEFDTTPTGSSPKNAT